MSLSSALNTAQAIFNNTGVQTSTISKNISNSNDANYNRRSAVTSTTIYGGATVTMERSQNLALLRQTLTATSQDSGQQTLLKGVESIRSALGGNTYDLSPATYLANLRNALQDYAAKPSEASLGTAAINAAQDTVSSLNQATKSVQAVRAQADTDIANDVAKLNSLLSQFKVANDAVSSSTAQGNVNLDAVDQRESLVKQISGIIGVSTITRSPNDMAIYTSDGTTLFETSARTVTFSATGSYDANTVGKSVYIDGVAMNAGQGSTTSAQGSIEANLQLRDTIAPTYQKQLDEVARGLITQFAETSNTTPATTAAGLFTWAGGTIPAMGSADVTGLAGKLTLNSTAVADPTKLRDGGIAGAAYVKNTSGSSYATLLNSYSTVMSGDFTFDPAAGIDSSSSLLDFASHSVGWIEDIRSTATTAAESTAALLSRSTEAYSNSTGVSVDEELTLMLDVEQSYKAAAKLLSTIDAMLKAILDVAG